MAPFISLTASRSAGAIMAASSGRAPSRSVTSTWASSCAFIAKKSSCIQTRAKSRPSAKASIARRRLASIACFRTIEQHVKKYAYAFADFLASDTFHRTFALLGSAFRGGQRLQPTFGAQMQQNGLRFYRIRRRKRHLDVSRSTF